jgi:hypothetical protein
MGVVFLLQHLRDLGDFGITKGVIGGGLIIPLNVVTPYGRGLPPSGL